MRMKPLAVALTMGAALFANTVFAGSYITTDELQVLVSHNATLVLNDPTKLVPQNPAQGEFQSAGLGGFTDYALNQGESPLNNNIAGFFGAPAGAYDILKGVIFPGGTFSLANVGTSFLPNSGIDKSKILGTWVCRSFIMEPGFGNKVAELPYEKELVKWVYDFQDPNKTDAFIISEGFVRELDFSKAGTTTPVEQTSMVVLGMIGIQTPDEKPTVISSKAYGDAAGNTILNIKLNKVIKVYKK